MLATAGAIKTFPAALRSAQTPINTIKAYRLDLRRFARFVPDDLAAVTSVQLTAAPESIRLLRRHLKVSGIRSGALFRGDRRYGGSNLPLEYSVAPYAWQKYCRKAGVTGTIHQLRHSRASQLIQAGVPLATVRKLLGHRNIQSTLRYAEVDQAAIKHDLLAYRRQRGRRR